MQWVFATEGFDISVDCQIEDKYDDTVLYYFEASQLSKSKWLFIIGLSDGSIPADDSDRLAKSPNLYIFPQGVSFCILSGQIHDFEWSNGAIQPEWKWDIGDTIGCCILLTSANNVSIFFTANGILMGKPIPIPKFSLVPTIQMRGITVDVNFGEDPAKPLKFDINKCPGLSISNLSNCNLMPIETSPSHSAWPEPLQYKMTMLNCLNAYSNDQCPCPICGQRKTKLGIHYGTLSCEGCMYFFARNANAYHSCNCKKCKTCIRYQKCLDAGMLTKSQRGRPPRKNI